MNKRRIITSFLLIAVLSFVFYYYFQAPESDKKIIVLIGGKEYPDEFFTDEFDYSTLKDKRIELNVYLKSTDFAYREETTLYEYSSLDEVWDLLSELEAPRIVIGFSKYLAKGSFCEAANRYFGNIDCFGLDSVGRNIGVLNRRQYSSVEFMVNRLNLPHMKGLQVLKMYLSSSGGAVAWSLFVNLDGSGLFKIELKQYPRR